MAFLCNNIHRHTHPSPAPLSWPQQRPRKSPNGDLSSRFFTSRAEPSATPPGTHEQDVRRREDGVAAAVFTGRLHLRRTGPRRSRTSRGGLIPCYLSGDSATSKMNIYNDESNSQVLDLHSRKRKKNNAEVRRKYEV